MQIVVDDAVNVRYIYPSRKTNSERLGKRYEADKPTRMQRAVLGDVLRCFCSDLKDLKVGRSGISQTVLQMFQEAICSDDLKTHKHRVPR